MKKIITGVAGFIGFHIAKYYLEHGDKILGIDNLNDYYDPTLKEARLSQLNNYNNFSFHKIDIVDSLLEYVDEIPNSIVLAQAANESGWGSSRFAREIIGLQSAY